MKKSIKLVLVVAAIVALPLMAAGTQDDSKEKQSLVDFIEYCRTCENLRQVNPAKDYTKASLHELKSAARFYEEQEVYACMTLANDWCVQKRAVTTMRTNFCVGQEVYLMRDNKIAKDKILRINLVKDEDSEYCKLVLMGDQAHYTKGGYVFATKQELVESLMKE